MILRGLMSFLIAFGGAPVWAAPAHDLFKAKCKSCHKWDSEGGDDYGIFDKNGTPCRISDGTKCIDKGPETPALIDRVMAAVKHQDGVEPMPRKKLSDADIATLQGWADAEKADIAAKLAAAGPGANAAPADPKCSVHDKAPEGAPGRTVVTDREAASIMELSCSHCHGKTGSFSSGEKGLVGALILSSMLASYAKWRRSGQPAAAAGGSTIPLNQANEFRIGCELLRRLKPNTLLKASTEVAITSGILLGTAQFTKDVHRYNQFNNGDGSLNPDAFAGRVTSLTKVHGSITSGYMPIRSPWFPKILSDANRKKLDAWFEQQQERTLYEGCQVYPAGGGNVPYEDAAEACGKTGGRLPTAEQATKLAAQGVGGGSCLWTSSFSDDVANPRKTLSNGALSNAGRGSTCSAMCLR